MEGVVVGAVIGATLQVVLPQLLSLPLNRIKDFKKDLEKLKTSFDYVHDILHDANMQNVTDKAVKRWMKNLEALAFEADNVLDEINYQLLSKEVKKITQSKPKINKVRSFFSCSKNPIANRLSLSDQIREINNKLEQSNKDATNIKLRAKLAGVRVPDPGSHASASIETDSFSSDPIFIGRENDVSSIVDKLVTASPEERVLSVLPIFGMGGLGKTTLARKVFSDQKIISHFGKNRVWVHVPRNFDVVVLLKNILTSMTTENVEYGNREALLKKLHEKLGRERYLLVLDDVWNLESDKWDDFKNSLSGVSSSVGICVVVTTRSPEVASVVKTLDADHELEGLPDDDCWSIIKAKLSSNAADQYEEMGRNIARKCQGLPLAAKVVGGLLRNKSRDEWISFEKDWFSNFGDENPISKILKLSFDNLSLPLLKKCFAYFSIFSKGFEIKKKKLIQLWMAEGLLLETDQNNNMESIGSKFFSSLLQSSLLQVVKRDAYGNATCCNMHDLVHDLARSILCENSQHRYIGYSPSGDIESRSIPKEKERYVRTLFFNGSVSDINFSNFKSLRTLVLLGKEIDTLPNSINALIHLRYLDTSETRIRYFPESLGELYHLETLTGYLEKLPDSLKYLINLRHLYTYDRTTLPPEIGRLTSLQTLEHFKVSDEKGYRISELGSLKNLKGKLEIDNLELVRDKDEALSANLYQKKGIIILTFEWSRYRSNGEVDEVNEESVLEGLQPHPNLEILHIIGFNGRRFPAWNLKKEFKDGQALNNLMDIKLQHCRQVEELPMLGHLPHLKSLILDRLYNVRSIGSSFYNIDNCSRKSRNEDTAIQVFPALERLVMIDMPSLTEWAEVELPPAASEGETNQVVVFPRLENLILRGCRKLTSAPSHFPCLKELRIGGIDSGLPLENICATKLSSLTHLYISGIKDLECLPDGLFSNNHNMLEFNISECLNLKSITTERHKGGFTSLRDLSIHDCKGLTRFPIEMIESCASSLVNLSLSGLTNMQVRCLIKMPRLILLVIMDAPRFSTEDIGSLDSLETLAMSPCSSSWDDNVSFNMAVDAILQASRLSLRGVRLHGMSDWECLPDQIQNLTSLSTLTLSDYGMEALPEWFGNLSSLRSLSISNFKKLRHMPSKEAMQRLTKLDRLDIAGSPLLSKQMLKEEEDPKIVDSEWHKISHIPDISYNHRRLSN